GRARAAGMEARGAGAVPADPRHGALQELRLRLHARRWHPDHSLQPASSVGRTVGAHRSSGRTLMVLLIAAAFLILLILGVPVAFVIGVSGFIGLWWSGQYPLTVIVKQTFEGVDSFVLLAIPLFILAGALMETGGIAVRLVRLAQVLVGWIRGGLRHGGGGGAGTLSRELGGPGPRRVPPRSP